ncbi:hypothetical protein CSB09_00210 [Candidatus Gracilibacteria bacterium]|nr:MAG: hypothetical protein CSB09_00210 [Candidatus Gracilibacteria bacterium]
MFILFRYTLTTLFALVGAYFFIIFTLDISFTSADIADVKTQEQSLHFDMASITSSGSIKVSSLEKVGSGKTNFPLEKDFPKDKAVRVSFGRLANAFVLPTYGKPVSYLVDQFKQKNDSTIEIGNISCIFSLYDPFKNYTIQDKKGRYSFETITNGSVYFGEEEDGTVSVYSVDSIGELTFLSEGKKMTDMILFPGMYVRFDPKENKNLKNADILRIVQVLQAKVEGLGTGIEFADPRVNTSNKKDAYFMYRLPKKTKILFEMLQVSFQDRVQAVRLIKQYSLENREFNPSNKVKWLKNPTKKIHRLLGELQFVLSEAVTNNDMSPEKLSREYYRILGVANKIDPNNKIPKIMEQFLIDGRFALFQKKNNLQFKAIYNTVAGIVGVAPTSRKTKLFEALSSIFSENLIEKDMRLTGIHTYLRAAEELKKTLDMGEMDTKDYFDLSLYAFKIFEKMSDKNNRIEKEALEDDKGVVFQIYITIFKATQQYIKGLANGSDRENAQQSLVIQFYEPMMNRLRLSVYGTYVVVKDGTLYLRDDIVKRDEAQVSIAFRTYLTEVTDLAEKIYNSQLEKAHENSDNTQSISRLKTDIIYLKGFLAMIRKNAYKGYLNDPYVAVDKKTPLPLLEDDTIVRVSQKQEEETVTEPPIDEGSVGGTPLDEDQESRNIDGIQVSFQKEDGLFSQITFQVNGVPISVIGQFNSPEFEIFLLDIPAYNSQILGVLSSLSSQPENISIIAPQKMILIDDQSYYLDQ